MNVARVLVLVVAAGTFLPAGCGSRVPITQYPPFWTPELKTILVEPFRNDSLTVGAGRLFARRLAGALADNGTYEVVNLQELHRDVEENPDDRTGTRPPASSQPAATQPAEAGQAPTRQAQLILRGAVSEFYAGGYVERWIEPVHPYVDSGWGYYSPWRTYSYFYNEAAVAATASVIRAADGAVLASTPAAVHAMETSGGDSPPISRTACLNRAMDRVVAELVDRFAVVRKTIRVKASEALRTASDGAAGQWTWRGKLSATDERMFVVVALPPVCDRNAFRLTVRRKVKDAPVLAEREFTWSRGAPTQSFPLSPRELAEAGGRGDYVVEFHAAGQVVMQRKFKIE